MADVVVDYVIETPRTEEELAKCRKEIRCLKRVLPEEWEFFLRCSLTTILVF
jgi:hypothetical protein